MNGIARNLLFFFTVFLPFEDFFFKWLPVSDSVYTLLRSTALESCLYALFLALFLGNLFHRRPAIKSRIEILVACFIGLSLLSIVINHAAWLPALLNLKALVRYVALYYIILALDLTEEEAIRLVKAMILVGFIQALIGLLQAYGGGPSDFWLPRASAAEIGGIKKEFAILTKGIEKGAVSGAFGHSVAMALYLLITGILLLAALFDRHSTSHQSYLLILGCVGIALFFTYSRGIILALALSAIISGYLVKNTRAIVTTIYLLALVMVCYTAYKTINPAPGSGGAANLRQEYVDPLSNIGMIFSSAYVEHSEHSRLWMLREVGGAVLQTGTLIGFSPDEELAKEQIYRSSNRTLSKLLYYGPFEDVYWIAILTYYGLLGTLLFATILYRLYRYAMTTFKQTDSPFYRQLALALTTLLLVTFPLTFLVRTFEFRSFSYYLWLMAGLVVCEYRRLAVKRESFGA